MQQIGMDDTTLKKNDVFPCDKKKKKCRYIWCILYPKKKKKAKKPKSQSQKAKRQSKQSKAKKKNPVQVEEISRTSNPAVPSKAKQTP
jgi:Zn-finger protein